MENQEAKNEALIGGSELNAGLAAWQGGFDGFISECESLQKELELHDPYNAAADGARVKLLIEIAKKWRGGYGG